MDSVHQPRPKPTGLRRHRIEKAKLKASEKMDLPVPLRHLLSRCWSRLKDGVFEVQALLMAVCAGLEENRGESRTTFSPAEVSDDLDRGERFSESAAALGLINTALALHSRAIADKRIWWFWSGLTLDRSPMGDEDATKEEWLLAGDFLLTGALSLVAGKGRDETVEILSSLVEDSASEGMGRKFAFEKGWFLSPDDYVQSIREGCGRLLKDSCRIGWALRNDPDEQVEERLQAFGTALGAAMRLKKENEIFQRWINGLSAGDDEQFGEGYEDDADVTSVFMSFPWLYAIDTSPRKKEVVRWSKSNPHPIDDGDSRRKAKSYPWPEGARQVGRLVDILDRADALRATQEKVDSLFAEARRSLQPLAQRDMKGELLTLLVGIEDGSYRW